MTIKKRLGDRMFEVAIAGKDTRVYEVVVLKRHEVTLRDGTKKLLRVTTSLRRVRDVGLALQVATAIREDIQKKAGVK